MAGKLWRVNAVKILNDRKELTESKSSGEYNGAGIVSSQTLRTGLEGW